MAKRGHTTQAGVTAAPKAAVEDKADKSGTSQGQPVVAQAGVTAKQAPLKAAPLKPAPVKPAPDDIAAGVATSVKDYMKELIPYVQERLLAVLKRRDSAFASTLAEALPFVIGSDVKQTFKNFREPWDMSHCLDSLTSTQLYEASGNIFWLDILGTKFGGHALPDAEVTWRQLEEGMALWSADAYISSCDDARYRRYIFQGTYPPWWQMCLTLKV